jgi:hypothetical protein
MVAGGRGHGAEASSSRAGHANARGEQELWEELQRHGATLDRALNEALRVHGGPVWRVFQVGHRYLSFSFRRSGVLFLYYDAYGF